MIVPTEIINVKCYSLQLPELIPQPRLAALVTNPFVASNKFVNFYEGVESTVSLRGLIY